MLNTMTNVPLIDAQPEDDPVVFRAEGRVEEAEMDMTPMVDVTFLLLIFFMVTAAFSLQKSIEVPNPDQEQPSTQVREQPIDENPDFVTVRVDPFNTYRVITVDWDVEAPSEQELLIKLREARQGNSMNRVPTTLRVEAHEEALHERVVAALDAGTEVGMDEVQLLTIQEEF